MERSTNCLFMWGEGSAESRPTLTTGGKDGRALSGRVDTPHRTRWLGSRQAVAKVIRDLLEIGLMHGLGSGREGRLVELKVILTEMDVVEGEGIGVRSSAARKGCGR